MASAVNYKQSIKMANNRELLCCNTRKKVEAVSTLSNSCLTIFTKWGLGHPIVILIAITLWLYETLITVYCYYPTYSHLHILRQIFCRYLFTRSKLIKHRIFPGKFSTRGKEPFFFKTGFSAKEKKTIPFKFEITEKFKAEKF